MADNELWDDGSSISSPLGEVRKGFLRCYIVFSTYKTFSEDYKRRLADAIKQAESSGGLILESVEYKNSCALLCVGISVDVAPQTPTDEILIAANGFDPFLRFHFFMTNTHKPDDKEITEYLAEIA